MRPVFLLSILILLSGCAGYGDWVRQMEQRIARDDPQAALRVLEERAGERGRDAVLYQLNRAMILRMQGDLRASNAAFEAAKAAIDSVLAVSVSEQAGAITVNDAQRSYVGEPFERAYIHFYAALNYLDLGDPDGARVEMLQLDALLATFAGAGQPGAALPRYLAGMIFESRGEWSDALIAYRKALEGYRNYPAEGRIAPPAFLGRDLVRLAGRLGLDEQAKRWGAEFGVSPGEAERGAGEAEIVLLVHAGLAPLKHETGVAAPTPGGRIISVAMPVYASRRPVVRGAVLSAGAGVTRTALAEDIEEIARATLDLQYGSVLARTVARAAIKHEASRQAGRENELVGLVVNLAGLASERADTRSWTTLPNRIYLARLPVPSGPSIARVELEGRGGVIETLEIPVDLAPGEIRIVSVTRVSDADLIESPRVPR